MRNPVPLLASVLIIFAAFGLGPPDAPGGRFGAYSRGEVGRPQEGQHTDPAGYWAENRPPAWTARSLPTRLFPADNWWNLSIADAPRDPKSADFIASIGWGKLRYDWGNNYGLPYVTVSGNYPKVTFQSCSYWNETDQIAYPIPIPALTEPGWTEDLMGTIDNPVSTGDRHLLIVDVDNQYLYEIYQPYRNATGAPQTMSNGTVLQPGAFYCASAAFWDMKTNNTRSDGWTSSDAAGLQVLPGLVQYDEVMGPEPITHAHRITLNWSSSQSPLYVWPATHSAGSYSATNPPLGSRLRLKASKDLSFAGPHARKVLQAMKDYGVIFADNGGHGMITGTNDPRWGNYDSPIRTEFVYAFNGVSLNDFEVIELGWSPEGVVSRPVVTWPTPAPIVQGIPLGAVELNATANVPGTYVYTPAAGTVLSPGNRTLKVVFTPADSTRYLTATYYATLTVNATLKTTPVITWPAPAAITQGTALSTTQLKATASVLGAFVYTPAAGTMLATGTHTLTLTFTPSDTTRYTTATAATTMTVNPAPKTTPVITWPTPAAITQGTALSTTQLKATASVLGAFVYTPAAGTVLATGTHTLTLTFTPSDTTRYTTATASTTIAVNPAPKTAPVITWPAPAAITQGTALSTTQLRATASVPGAFIYTPAAGTVLATGTHTLSLTFTPSDTTRYTTATASTTITVNALPYGLTVTRPSGGTVSGAGINCGTNGTACSVKMPGALSLGLQATADAGYAFSGWTGDCSGTSPRLRLLLNGWKSCGASFAAVAPGALTTTMTTNTSTGGTLAMGAPYTLTVIRPAGGTVQAAGINCGTTGTNCSVTMPAALWLDLVAMPDPGFSFAGWTGACSGTQPSYSLVLAGPRTCSATFTAVQ